MANIVVSVAIFVAIGIMRVMYLVCVIVGICQCGCMWHPVVAIYHMPGETGRHECAEQHDK